MRCARLQTRLGRGVSDEEVLDAMDDFDIDQALRSNRLGELLEKDNDDADAEEDDHDE
jgi:hypothetical protein